MTHSFPALQRPACSPPSRQRGAVLLIGMALLIIITLFAMAAIRGIMLQERIAGSLYDKEIAFSAAESTLRWAERQFMIATTVNPVPAVSQAFVNGIILAANDPACNGDLNCPNNTPPNTEAYFSDPARQTYTQLSAITNFTAFAGDALTSNIFQSGNNADNNTTAAFGPPLYMAVNLNSSGDCGSRAIRINTVGVGRSDNTVVVLESIVCTP